MDLTKLALLTALAGTILLIILSKSLEPKEISISEINEKMIDEYVKISGNVTSAKTYSSLTVFTLKDETDEIKVASYKEFNISGNVEVIGKVQEYKGILEIEAEKIQSKS